MENAMERNSVLMLGTAHERGIEWRVDLVEPFCPVEIQQKGLEDAIVNAFVREQLTDAYLTLDQDDALCAGRLLAEIHQAFYEAADRFVHIEVSLLNFGKTCPFPS